MKMSLDAETLAQLDRLEEIMQDGLIKICRMYSLADESMTSPDIDGRWELMLEHYVADAVENINSYPDAAMGFASYLGMALAAQWDRDWAHYKDKPYKYYYGDRGFDNMDDHIADDILRLSPEEKNKVKECILSCSQSVFGLLRHEAIDTQTKLGFYALVRCYSVMFRTGVSIELKRRGYEKCSISQ